MATNQANVMTSHNLLNYSGTLFNKGNTKTPFSTLIGGKSRTVQAWQFDTSLDYATGGGTAQPAITETQSLTAPTPEFINRTPNSNVCQIFQKSLEISYGKMSSMNQLSGLNIAGQSANPSSEFDFQLANALAAMRNDIEFTFLNGAYQLGSHDDVAYKTRGIATAISTNTQAAGSKPLSYWAIAELIQKIGDNHGDAEGLVLMARPVNIMQLNADASANGLTVIPESREINGLKITEIMTPFGSVGIVANPYVASGTALLVNPSVCAPVYMPVPGKPGTPFCEPLAKNGASERWQLYCQVGLDYGAEHMHGKLTGLTNTFTAPDYSKRVFVVNSGT